MGILRLILALNVLFFHIDHLKNWPILDPFVAVSIFLVISGFYMALVLNEKYVGPHRSYSLFITNRFLRVYPIYWLMLIMFLIFSSLKLFFQLGEGDNALAHFADYYSGASALTYGAAILNFSLRNLTLIFTADYFWGNSKSPGFFLVQQAWTLQLEVIFYLIAPFIARKQPLSLATFSALYLIIRRAVSHFHLISETSLISSLLHYFIFFLLGIWSYQLYQYLKSEVFSQLQVLGVMISSLVIIYSFLPTTQALAPQYLSLGLISFYLLVAGSLPFFFIFTQRVSWDFEWGELSYPIYISHFLVIKLINNLPYFQSSPVSSTLAIMLLTLATALGLAKYVELPIHSWRQRRILQPSLHQPQPRHRN